MKKLTNELKRMLTGLAYQDAAEYLPMDNKMQALGYGAQPARQPSPAPLKPATKRIALISDGRGLGAPLDYVIDACLRQHARIDLLVHGPVCTETLTALERQIERAGIAYVRMQLGGNPVEGILEYICNHPSLIFLVAMPDDNAAKVLIEEVIPQRGGRMPVPLVLIEGQSLQRSQTQTAA